MRALYWTRPGDAEDLAHDALMRILGRGMRLEGETIEHARNAVARYGYLAIRSIFLDERRRERVGTRSLLAGEDFPDREQDSEQDTDHDPEFWLPVVMAAVETLTPAQKAAVQTTLAGRRGETSRLDNVRRQRLFTAIRNLRKLVA